MKEGRFFLFSTDWYVGIAPTSALVRNHAPALYHILGLVASKPDTYVCTYGGPWHYHSPESNAIARIYGICWASLHK